MKATSENNSRKSYPHYAHIFRTMEAQVNQSVRFRAKIVIFAQAGQAMMAEVRICCGSPRHQHGDVQLPHAAHRCALCYTPGWRVARLITQHHAASRTPSVITCAEACPRGHGLMDLHYANWERFCRYHVGDWYGLWTPYTVDGVALAPRQCIRSFQRTADGRAITHQNHYRSADSRQETKTFGPYTPATTRGVFVEASFSWGSPAVAG